MHKWVKNGVMLLLVMSLLFSSGCWSRKEPDSLAIVNSVLNDMEGDRLSFIFEIMEPSPAADSKGKGGGVISIYARGKGDSLAEVLRNATDSLDRRLHVGHIEARFVSEKVAKKGIASVLDFYLRVHRIRQNPFMIVIKGDNPQLIYSCDTGMSDNLGTYITKTSKIEMQATGHASLVKTLDFMKDYYREGKEPTMGVVEVVENPDVSEEQQGSADSKAKKYLLKFTGLAVFKEDKFLGYLDEIETRSFNIIMGNLKGSYISLPVTGKGDPVKGTVVELIDIKPSIDVTYKEEPKISVTVKFNIAIAQEAFPRDIDSKEYKKDIQEAFQSLMEEQLKAAIQKAQGYGSDIFGFGSKVHIKYPKKWPDIKDQWNEIFARADIKVKVESKIIGVGELRQPFTGEVRE